MSTATNPMPYGGGLSLTKRELFAAMTLQGIISRDPQGVFDPDAAVREAVEVADRLVTALDNAA
jgi:hypothetical protein